MPPKRETSWTTFVRDWAKGAGVSYPCASTDPRCREDYEAWKAKNGMKATRPRKAPGEPKRKYVRKDPNAPVVPKRKYVRKDPIAWATRKLRAESKKEDKSWVDDWSKSIGASFEAKPKRKYVRKAKPPTGESLATRNPTLAAKMRVRTMANALTELPAVSAIPMTKTKRKYTPRKKREPTAAEFVSAVARLNANPSLMEWSKG
jgi:hypothetical protein